jgi:hypothetical protein
MISDEFKRYHASDREALLYRFKLFAFTLLIYASLIAWVNDWISGAVMAVFVSVSVTRWLIAFHELLHLRKAEQLDFITRLQPIPFSPVSPGYREYRDIHKGHHQFTASAGDPDAFHIRGGFFRALLGSVTQQEQAVVRYIFRHGVNREFLVLMIIRLVLFVGLFLTVPVYFVWWWLVLRVTYIINDFVFFHIVHYQNGKTGTFHLPLPAWLRYPFIALYGFDVVYATMYHDIHHKHSLVAARHLPRVAQLEKTVGQDMPLMR